ncbi:uncharacterized protein RSE6_01858 [Rhynchosporium secalis]|uniref:NACHT domain-containing protein n=1 Tax=Rhynchosporium secalis TaxID=38038 RepID=A0A1E1LYW0_RHYSE|nr:uncharacterized protein RSE6_01858 [Rhynchosporium secalis]
MILIVFRLHWDPRGQSQWQATTDLEISSREKRIAFEMLMEERGVMKDYCFCFFIDGLDEFDDSSHDHSALVRKIQSWTNRGDGNVKICVSSREDNSFLNNLPVNQRLRLHLVTQNDMRTSVEASLDQFDRFATIASGNSRAFVQKAVERSDGVFLWIKLVLYKFRDILEGGGSLEDLHETLNHLPKDLELLFAGMLMSIPREDQNEAWAVLAVLMAASQHRLELYIFDYSHVKECLERHKFEEELVLMPMTKSQILAQQKNFALHVNRVLKGIVDVKYNGANGASGELDEDGLLPKAAGDFASEGRLKVTHRSIYEHLKYSCPREMKVYIDNLAVLPIMLRCMIQYLIKVEWDYYTY